MLKTFLESNVIKDRPLYLPLFPLKGAMLLPRGQISISVFEKRYISLVDDALKNNRMIGIIQPKPHNAEHGSSSHQRLFTIGCAGRITQFSETFDGRYIIAINGIVRFELIEEIFSPNQYRTFSVSYDRFMNDFLIHSAEDTLEQHRVHEVIKTFIDISNLRIEWEGLEEASNETLVNALCMHSPFGPLEKQALLEAPDLKTRTEILLAVIEIELAREYGHSQFKLQ